MKTEMAPLPLSLANPVSRRAVLSAAVAGLAGAALGPGLLAAPAAAAVIRNHVYTVSSRNTATSATYPRTEFRALWTASVVNIDWPSKSGLTVAAQRDIIFDTPVEARLAAALKLLGVDPMMLSGEAGHA